MSTPEYREGQDYSPKLVSERTYWSFDFRAEQYSATIALAWVSVGAGAHSVTTC